MDRGKKALLIETNRKNLEILSAFLEKHAIEVRGVAAMEDALEADVRCFDVAVIDLSGLDGRVWDFCKRLHEGRVPFLIIYPPSAGCRSAMRPAGCGVALEKPLDPATLLSMVSAVLREEAA